MAAGAIGSKQLKALYLKEWGHAKRYSSELVSECFTSKCTLAD